MTVWWVKFQKKIANLLMKGGNIYIRNGQQGSDDSNAIK